jgi:hypothetical protein
MKPRKFYKNNIFTGKLNSMKLKVTDEQLERWKNNEPIQVVMAHLTDTEREFLITGMSPEEQEKFYSEFKEP